MHLVYNLVTKQLQGKINVKSEVNQGRTFTIDIPLFTPESNSGGLNYS